MVWGRPKDERITCVHEELFIRGWNRHLKTVPFTAPLLPEVRRLVNEGSNDKADSLITTEAEKQMQAMGARQRWPLIPHPAFDLHIRHLDNVSKADSYRRQLNMENGVTSVFGCDGGQGTDVAKGRGDATNDGSTKSRGSTRRRSSEVQRTVETHGAVGVQEVERVQES